MTEQNKMREWAKSLASLAHELYLNSLSNPDEEAMDSNLTEEFSVMFQEELDKLNNNK